MNVAIIGCGEIGRVRAAAVRRTPGLRLALVCDAVPERAEAVAREYGCEGVTDWTRAVRREDLDIVTVSTPNDLHAPVSIAAMEAGKHILCEKPLALNPPECRAMVECAERHRVKLMTGFNYRLYPAVRKARAILDRGEIGELMYVRSYIGHPGGREFGSPWVLDGAVAGGGTLLDNGSHILDLTRYFLGEVTEVSGYRTRMVWPVEPCEDNAFALFRSKEGRVALVHSSWTEWLGYGFRVEVYGTRGYVTAAYPPMRTLVGRVHAGGGRAARRIHLFPWFQIRERLHGHLWTVRESFAREYAGLVAAIREDREPVPSGYDGLRVLEMAYGVYASSEHGRRVEL